MIVSVRVVGTRGLGGKHGWRDEAKVEWKYGQEYFGHFVCICFLFDCRYLQRLEIGDWRLGLFNVYNNWISG